MRGRGAVVAVAVLLAAGCVAPATTTDAYTDSGRAAVESAISATATARLAVQERLGDDAPHAFADVVVTDSESAIAPIEASFGSVDPPSPTDDAVRDAVMKALGDAADALSQSRIAVRRDDSGAMQQAVDGLAGALAQLEDLKKTLS